jgi:hypothetical protein
MTGNEEMGDSRVRKAQEGKQQKQAKATVGGLLGDRKKAFFSQ